MRSSMPVRSLSSSVLKWPDHESVSQKLRVWVEEILRNRTDIVSVGYFGSYARGDWGVGSDLDLLIIVRIAAEIRQTFRRLGYHGSAGSDGLRTH